MTHEELKKTHTHAYLVHIRAPTVGENLSDDKYSLINSLYCNIK